MLVKLFDESWLVRSAHILSEEVLVVGCWLSSEFIWRSLVVISHQMTEHSWGHVSMIWTWSHGWEHHRTSLLVALSSDEPAWEDDGTEVRGKQEPSLFTGLDLKRMEMHVKLWANV